MSLFSKSLCLAKLSIPPFPISNVVENVLVAPQGQIPRCCNVAVRAEGNHEDSKCPSDDLWNKVKTLLTEHSIQKKECQTSLQEVMETSQ